MIFLAIFVVAYGAFIEVHSQATCRNNGQLLTSDKYTVTTDCKSTCRCSLTGYVQCVSLCPPTIAKCTHPAVSVNYDEPVPNTKCFCEKQVCVVPGNVEVRTTQGKNTILSCSFKSISWTFKGNTVTNKSKYSVKESSLEIKNVQPDDTGEYTCGDKKLHQVKLLKASCNDGRTSYTSETFTPSRDCTKNCKCSLISNKPVCLPLCPVYKIKCTNNQVVVSYKAPVASSNCMCSRITCAKPANVTIDVRRGRVLTLNCTYNGMSWKFNGQNIKSNKKYKMSGKLLQVRHVTYSDAGQYTCSDGKTYLVNTVFDDQKKSSSDSLSTIYIVTIAGCGFLIILVVVICFIKYKHSDKNNKMAKEGAVMQQPNDKKGTESVYTELNILQEEGQYTELTLGIKNSKDNETQSYNSHIYGISSESVDKSSRFIIPSARTNADATASVATVQDNEVSSTSPDGDLTKYIQPPYYEGKCIAPKQTDSEESNTYELSPDLVNEKPTKKRTEEVNVTHINYENQFDDVGNAVEYEEFDPETTKDIYMQIYD